MAKRIFNLKDVPEDEANDVREILERNGIEYYETREGIWGFSLPAIWIRQNEQFSIARKLIDELQLERTLEMREKFSQQKLMGSSETVFSVIAKQPTKVILYISIIVIILYFSIIPFYKLINHATP